MVGIDHFKRFNDLYGHAVGDQVIQVAARLLTSLLRQADILCRYGGEEFCIVLPGTTLQAAQSAAERMRARIEQHANESLRGMDITPITASIGLACVSQGATSLEALIDHADQALYTSKQNGRNRVTVWENAGGS
jgi:diguanylate cyclase (GGDEF)-like protein